MGAPESCGAHRGVQFGRWLGLQLSSETQQGDRTGAQVPERPICLSELEAVALMMLTLDAQQQSEWCCLTAGTLQHLAESLRSRLLRLVTDEEAGTTGVRPRQIGQEDIEMPERLRPAR